MEVINMPNHNFIDETGKQYGELTVLYRAENTKNGRAMWHCRCSCGNEIDVLGKSLRNGNTKSCGCYQRRRAAESNMKRAGSLVGQKFGKLLVLEESGFLTHPNGKRSRLYKCLCDCGNYCEVQHQYLAFGDTTSCGCIRSKGEFQIVQLLKEHNIKFQQEYIFDDLKDQLALRFDFAIFNQNKLVCLIEFQGEQHTYSSNGFYSEDLIKHDKQKVEYCKQHNIPLYHLYYKEKAKTQVTWDNLYNIKEIQEIVNGL